MFLSQNFFLFLIAILITIIIHLFTNWIVFKLQNKKIFNTNRKLYKWIQLKHLSYIMKYNISQGDNFSGWPLKFMGLLLENNNDNRFLQHHCLIEKHGGRELLI